MFYINLAGLSKWLCIQTSQDPQITITVQKQYNKDLYDAVNYKKKLKNVHMQIRNESVSVGP